AIYAAVGVFRGVWMSARTCLDVLCVLAVVCSAVKRLKVVRVHAKLVVALVMKDRTGLYLSDALDPSKAVRSHSFAVDGDVPISVWQDSAPPQNAFVLQKISHRW